MITTKDYYIQLSSKTSKIVLPLQRILLEMRNSLANIIWWKIRIQTTNLHIYYYIHILIKKPNHKIILRSISLAIYKFIYRINKHEIFTYFRKTKVDLVHFKIATFIIIPYNKIFHTRLVCIL